MVHYLKTWPEYFQAVQANKKKFEVRKNDRNFQVGDLLSLDEFIPGIGYTGRSSIRNITYILNDPQFVKEGYVIMSIE
jgi:hypothetical protein